MTFQQTVSLLVEIVKTEISHSVCFLLDTISRMPSHKQTRDLIVSPNETALTSEQALLSIFYNSMDI